MPGSSRRNRSGAYGAYELVSSSLGGFIVRRTGRDRRRTVALLDSIEQWDRFIDALKSGRDEVAAVHAVDAPEEGRP